MPDTDPIIKLVDICKSYQMGETTQHVLQGVSLSIYPGEYVCIMGPSGCGKSTLLNVLGCLDQPTTGDYYLGGLNVAHLEDDDLSAARNKNSSSSSASSKTSPCPCIMAVPKSPT